TAHHKRILLVSHEYPPIGGGGATAARTLAEEQVREGHEVVVLTSGMPDLPRTETVRGVQVVRTACWRRARHYSTAPELASWLPSAFLAGDALLRASTFDVVHAHFVVPGAIVARPLATRHGLPLVLTAHGSDVPGYNPDRFSLIHRLIRPYWRYLANGADSMTVPSQHLARLIASAGGPDALLVPNAFAASGSVPDRARVRGRILVATRLVRRKGVQDLIAAVAGMKDVELIVAGDGPHAPVLRELAKSLSCPVDFRGFIDREALAELYATASIFVLPSSHENFPMVLLEAMGAGCAVVTTTAPGCQEVVGDAGICVPAGDVAALRSQLDRLVADPTLVDDLAARGRERVRQFAPDLVAAGFDHAYAAGEDHRVTLQPGVGQQARPKPSTH
ncbi:MAG TPA: glycosyltransferase family 4 protein, partial [Geminicoccus sp.]|uniref:glycosyltransferase family 4 protein n=1 Tax=Geminicoccus sp. TaxID=2024832 RepID=UPI002E2F9324